jgi:predicted CXXCH cytochrome family protein
VALQRKHAKPGVAILLFVCLTALATISGASDDESSNGRVPLPVIAEGRGESCVADTDFMRRNHMDMLKHQRDDTLIKGIRGEPFSLEDCIDCHAVNGPDNQPVTVSDPKHFCRSCHDYAAVSIDCFQCHASRPEAAAFPRERQFSEGSPASPGSK